MEKEIWRPVVGFEGLYEVSIFGEIRSFYRNGKIKKCPVDKHGYPIVCLCKSGTQKTCLLSRIVARAFPEICGEWFEGCDTNHKDENPLNNSASNIETCTRGYNINYGNHNANVSKTKSNPIVQLSKSGEFIKKWNSAIEVEKQLGISRAHISKVVNGKRKSAGGFKWKSG